MPSKNNPDTSGYFHVNFILSLIALLITQSAHREYSSVIVFIIHLITAFLFLFRGRGGSVYKVGGGRGGGLITHSWSSILWWQLCLASDLLNLSPFSSLGVAFICIIHINYRGQGEWGGRGLITWHNWRSTLLVAVVFGIRLLNCSIFWDRGGGENVLFRCVYICICIIMSFDAWLWYWFLLLVFLHACDIFV